MGLGTWGLGDVGTGLGDSGTRGRGDVRTRGLGDSGTRGRGDVGTRGRGDVGTRGRGDVGTWGRGDSGTRGRVNSGMWGRIFTICLTFHHISQNLCLMIVTELYPGRRDNFFLH